MKREILFRGKLRHNGTWVYGCLVISSQGTPYIIPSDIIEQDGHHLQITSDNAYWVDLSTVGQYTGLKDKSGTKIFEGDIIKYYEDGIELIAGYVIYKDCNFYVKGVSKLYGNCRLDDLDDNITIEVIGNIHDNKYLLK